MKRAFLSAAAAAVALTLLAGCASDPLAEQYSAGTTKNYISGEGTISEYKVADRGEPVAFQGETDSGEPVSSDDYAGKVLVLNFWYAGCPPCRVEAPELEEVNQAFAGQDVAFLGVNVRDQAAQSLSFAETLGVTYPSVMDADNGNLLLAFAGKVAPNAVPTTLVIDKQGRVAARFLGAIDGPSSLRTIINDTLAEGN
ncbi:TlpA disulfide reductase family protein [Conyzicola nivalis]|uniref:Thiol-disulfide isomerase n=1 Tax=Conyzicola nivalis TaxID=1477021 RepID=A0A916WJL7_9MICO|nr:TlpA disulfide reductase family protein [Conyzicola nivalis]GGB06139.1 thiol-disulfide isomerase [Conyzicola nivalis]